MRELPIAVPATARIRSSTTAYYSNNGTALPTTTRSCRGAAYGDVSGFGVGAHSDWQVMGTIDYTVKPWVDLHLGYRSLNFDYTASGGFNVGFNVHMRGPLLAATFKF